MFAAGYLNRQHKGSDLLAKALRVLPPALKSEIVLILLGEGGEALADTLTYPLYPLDSLADSASKQLLILRLT